MSRMWPFSKKVESTAVQPPVEPLPGPTPMDDVWEEIDAIRSVTDKLLNDVFATSKGMTELQAKVLALESKPEPPNYEARISQLAARFGAVDMSSQNMQEALNSMATALDDLRVKVEQTRSDAAYACAHADTAKRQSDEALVKASQKSGGSGGIGSIA